MTIFKILAQGKEIEIEATRQGNDLSVTHSGKRVDLRLIYSNGVSYILEQELPDGSRQQIRAVGHLDGDKRQLWVNGRTFTYERMRQQKRTGDENFNNSLSASIPAVVSEILVNVGDTVEVGDKLILLESMKMIIPIQAPCEGKISRINCAAGEAVQSGVQLIEIEDGNT